MAPSVFKNRETLSPDFPIEEYWCNIPHRFEQLKLLWSFYGDILDKGGESFLRRLQIIGPSGAGKTCTLKFFGKEFEGKAKERDVNVKHVYINLKFEGGKRVVLYRNLLGKVEPKLVSASFSAEELLKALFSYLQEKRRFILLTIDEIDYFVKNFPKEGIVYDLTRLNELSNKPCGVVGVTFLARETGFHQLLDPAELSTLGRNFIEFKPYTTNQIFDILVRRAQEAFRNGAYSDVTLHFIADITSSNKINGDLRYALDLLLYAGVLADNQGSVQLLPEHVRKVISQTAPPLTTEDLLNLPDKEKIVLLAVARSLHKGQPYASLREIRESAEVVCEEFGFKPIEGIEECLQDLVDRKIVDLKSFLKIGISGIPTRDLDRLLDALVKKMQAEAKHWK